MIVVRVIVAGSAVRVALIAFERLTAFVGVLCGVFFVAAATSRGLERVRGDVGEGDSAAWSVAILAWTLRLLEAMREKTARASIEPSAQLQARSYRKRLEGRTDDTRTVAALLAQVCGRRR